ncbi:MAG: hydrogenase expression/formation protein HypE [Methanocellales archaeon]|nr:hydrogenase expression/formation protein HypE [Methanocellales archaeon]MDD3291702.1 hydrogenase expression/formation protein HypE [Methanocellales archaeon]MDD5235052.1 hydrogenase expression/formation protein HypE [Methanocellales archaeon]MDD5485190.1 hydrogenase expression/formation protein HypE [Methanocellales archaeon]
MHTGEADLSEKTITLAHGAGGVLMQELISQVLKNISPHSVGSVGLSDLDDGATVFIGDREVVLTTDSHVIKPLFFPGGDIGKIAVCGTINDLAVMGARPIALTSSIIVEEGFSIAKLERIVRSMNEIANEADVAIITGDTKVMEKGALDNLVLNTSGIGVANEVIRDSGLNVGDKVIVTGTIGDHGISLLAFREGFSFETELESDAAPLWGTIKAALDVGGVTAMKDPTRGGLASALNEMAKKSCVGILIREDQIPFRDAVRAASEMLGIDPLEVANEGKAIIGVKPDNADLVLEAIQKTKYGREARIIGEVTEEHKKKVVLETGLGGKRYVETPLGEPIPRVC